MLLVKNKRLFKCKKCHRKVLPRREIDLCYGCRPKMGIFS